MIIIIPRNKAPEFERSMICNPIVEVISVSVNETTVEYNLDCPDFFFQVPTYTVFS